MMLTSEVKQYIDQSVLCWLATAATDHMPNVSPKEVFTFFDDQHLIVANIASPKSVKNIKVNPKVCVSFIDILVQKGFQLKGVATIASKKDEGYSEMEAKLLEITQGNYPFSTITKIKVEEIRPIIAPKYHLYPDTTEGQQIESAKKAYGF
ncbi:MAG: pyridoxamine 5'-phosphate oxidase family protein [Bacteroidota bacterium]